MLNKSRLVDLLEGSRQQKIILGVCVAVILVLELIIYMTLASQAGHKSYVVVSDMNGAKVYETSGTAMTSYEKLVFENTFGPLSNYQIHIQSETVPFPFRAWLATAVGIPVGLIMLLAFLIKAFQSIFYGEEKDRCGDEDPLAPSPEAVKQRFGSVLHVFGGGTSIFYIGFLVATVVVLIWVVPNFLGDVAKMGLSMVREFKWFFLGVGIFLAFIITWVIYLRYKLSKRMLDNQLDLEKFRVEKQLLVQEQRPLLTASMNEVQEN
jgi:hypothetical protein